MRHLREGRESTEKLLNEYIDYLLRHSDSENPAWNLERKRSWAENKWNYIDGCMITGILQLYEITGEERYLAFADRFVSGFVTEEGEIPSYEVKEYSLDNVNPGRNLYSLYDLTKKEKYRRAIELVRSQLEAQPRTKAGSFWHKKIYPWQVWLDGIYMAQPFYMDYEMRYNGDAGIADACAQIRRVEQLMKDPKTGLYFHGYDESRSMYWADPETGLSPNFWLRAIGWFILGLTDILELLLKRDEYKEERCYMQKMLSELVTSLSAFQDADSGMFYQLVDRKELRGNYLETSGSALIAAAILKAVRLGLLPGGRRAMGEKIFYGICEHRLCKTPEGMPCLAGICLVAGLGGEKRRDGSTDYYLSEPVVNNDAKGVGPFLLAYTEMLRD